MMQLLTWVALGLAVLWLHVPAPALSQAALPTHARIVVVGCAEGVQERALLEQIRVELLSAGVTRVESVDLYAQGESQPETEPLDVATLRIDFGPCQPVPRDIALGVADRRTGKHVEHTLAIAEIPASARARAIALSLVELLRGVWRSLTPVYEPLASAEPPPPESDGAPPDLAPENVALPALLDSTRERSRIEWMGMSRIYPQTDSGDLASSLAYSKAISPQLRIRAGGIAAGGGGDGSNVHIFQGTGRFGLAACSVGDRPTIEVGTAWDVGWAQVRGRGAGENSGFIAIGTLEATLRMLVAEHVEALVSLHGGYVLAPLTLDVTLDDGRKRSTGLEGSLLGIGVGLAGIL